MPLSQLILLLAALLNLALGTVILSRNWRHPAHQYYSAVAAAVALWSLTLALFRATTDPHLALLFIKGAYIAAALIAACFFAFTTVFPDRRTVSGRSRVVVGMLTALMVAFILVPGVLTRSIISAPYGNAVLLGLPEYLLFALFFVGFLGGGLYRIGTKMQRASGVVRIQLRYIFWGTLVAGVRLAGR